MSERALLFGATKSLVGVITDPETSESTRRPLGFVLLNAGLIHRVGPNRLYVRMARRVAASGCVAIRFDYSGIGDSAPRRDATSFARIALSETQEAMDLLANSRGVGRFVLTGICSGADHALRAASIDERVAGLVLIEGYSVPSRGHLFESYRRKLLSPRSWARLVAGRSELWSVLRELNSRSEEIASEEATPDSVLPSRGEVVAQLDAVMKRGVRLCFIYSATSPAYHQYRKLLRPRLRLAGYEAKSRLELFPASDHVFTLLSNQARVVRIVETWAREIQDPGQVSSPEPAASLPGTPRLLSAEPQTRG